MQKNIDETNLGIEMPPAMILCGGRGTRLRDVTELLPKPMVPIGDQPIVWHIMKTYAAFGVKRFILCLGYKKEEFIDYFLNFRARSGDITLNPGKSGEVIYHNAEVADDWQVTLADTGLEAKTALRISRAAKYLRPEDTDFFLTYGDGVSDIDIAELWKFHKKAGRAITVSAVHPEGRFGELAISGNLVSAFEEKPPRSTGYINGGFMVLRRNALVDFIDGRDVYFEQEPIRKAVAAGELAAFRHEGFWQCMDTPREYSLLNELWNGNQAPWAELWKKN